jgi:predicted ATPase
MMERMASRAGFIRSVEIAPSEGEIDRATYPWSVPAVAALADGVALDPGVTYLVGENGSGKSTLIEAFAVAAGLNPEGGSRNFAHSTRDSHSGLSLALRLIRGERRPRCSS